MNPFNEPSQEKSTIAPGNPPENIGGASAANPPKDFMTPQGILPTSELYAPQEPGFAPKEHVEVGGVILEDTPIEYNNDRYTATLTVRNTGDRPIQVGSHFHFFEANRYLEFDREAAYGCHLDIPATTAIRFEPGEEKQVQVVAYRGKRVTIGFNNLVNGYTGGEDYPTYYPARIRAIKRMEEYGFKNMKEDDEDAEYTSAQKK